jgi:hypothetical protein
VETVPLPGHQTLGEPFSSPLSTQEPSDSNKIVLLVANTTGDYLDALARLASAGIPRDIPVEVLLHKVDRLAPHEADDLLASLERQFSRSAVPPRHRSRLSTSVPDIDTPLMPAFGAPEAHFQISSTMDRSLGTAIGNILQRHASATPALEIVADCLYSSSASIFRVFIFDAVRTLCIATDTQSIDSKDGEDASASLCAVAAEFIDLFADSCTLYGEPSAREHPDLSFSGSALLPLHLSPVCAQLVRIPTENSFSESGEQISIENQTATDSELNPNENAVKIDSLGLGIVAVTFHQLGAESDPDSPISFSSVYSEALVSARKSVHHIARSSKRA